MTFLLRSIGSSVKSSAFITYAAGVGDNKKGVRVLGDSRRVTVYIDGFFLFPKLNFVNLDVIILSVENIFAAAQSTATVKTLM